MKKLLIALLTIIGISAQAQQLMTVSTLTAHTVASVLATPAIIDNLTVINTTTNVATLKFFDAATAITNYTQGATKRYATWSTNYTTVFTNATGVLVTNTFVGVFTGPTADVSGATIVRPTMISLAIPPGTTLSKDVKLQPLQGLSCVGNNDLTLAVTYRNVQ